MSRVEAREHVRLVLRGVGGAMEERPPAVLRDARVVAGREPVRACLPREGEQLGEAEAAVAADARVGRLAAQIAPHERRDDGAAELLAQVERDMRDSEAMARLAGGDHRLGRAARALGVGPVRVEPEAQRDADRIGAGAEQRDGAVDAAAHRHGDAARRAAGAEHGPERRGQRVDRKRLAADGSGLEQRQARDGPLQTLGVGIHDPVAVDRQPNRRPGAITRGVSESLDHEKVCPDPAVTSDPCEPGMPGGCPADIGGCPRRTQAPLT